MTRPDFEAAANNLQGIVDQINTIPNIPSDTLQQINASHQQVVDFLNQLQDQTVKTQGNAEMLLQILCVMCVLFGPRL